jgi:hypothetical protein
LILYNNRSKFSFTFVLKDESLTFGALIVEIDFTRGQMVLSERDFGDRLNLITDRKIKLSTTSNDGQESMLAILPETIL